MACYYPLKGFITGTSPIGKKDIYVTSYTTDHVERGADGKLRAYTDAGIHLPASAVYKDFETLPCGRCIGCRLDRSRQWADRMIAEAQYYEDVYFLTLTYDDEHLPRSDYVCPMSGEIKESFTLRKKDVQDWMKRLRWKVQPDKLRYYTAGEYGDRTFRPHYHSIVYGLKIPDLTLWKTSPAAHSYYTSDYIQSTWPHGYVVIADFSWETAAYTARYIMKKQLGFTRDFYEQFGLQPEFANMSLKPGIGRRYFDENYEKIKNYDYNWIDGRRIYPTRYWKDLLEETNDLGKHYAEQQMLGKLSGTDKDYLAYLETECYNKLDQIKSLYKKGV